MKIARFLVIGLLLIWFYPSAAQADKGVLTGCVTDAESGETIPFANVVITNQKGEVLAGGSTDFDGHYRIDPVRPGVYVVNARSVGYKPATAENLLVLEGTNRLNFSIKEDSLKIRCCFCGCIITYYEEEVTITDSLASGPISIRDQYPNSRAKAFPNPTKGLLYLNLPSGVSEVQLIDLQGRTLQQMSARDVDQLDLSSYKAGYYLLRFTGTQQTDPIKLLKY